MGGAESKCGVSWKCHPGVTRVSIWHRDDTSDMAWPVMAGSWLSPRARFYEVTPVACPAILTIIRHYGLSSGHSSTWQDVLCTLPLCQGRTFCVHRTIWFGFRILKMHNHISIKIDKPKSQRSPRTWGVSKILWAKYQTPTTHHPLKSLWVGVHSSEWSPSSPDGNPESL